MKLYTPKQIAKMLGVSDFTIWRYIKAGKLKAIKYTARNFRITEKDLKVFFNKHRTK